VGNPDTEDGAMSPSGIERREWRWATGFSLAVIASTYLPQIVGMLRSDAQTQFLGFAYNVEDSLAYLARMRQGASGAWLFHLPYTVEPHAAGPFYWFYLVLGKLAAIASLSPTWAFHIARGACALALLLATYALAGRFLPTVRLRRTALALFAVSGGLGWIFVAARVPMALGRMPVDFWVPDAIPWLAMYSSPHTCLSEAALFIALWAWIGHLEHELRRPLCIAAAAMLLASVIHIHVVAEFAVITGSYWAIESVRARRPLWRMLASAMLAAAPAVPYLIWVWRTFATNPGFSSWAAQALALSPSVGYYLVGFAWLLAFAVLAVVAGRRGVRRGTMLIGWLIIGALLLYAPYSQQRRFAEGLQMPLAVLAAVGVATVLAPRLARSARRQSLVIASLVAATSLTNAVILAGGAATALSAQEPAFRSTAELSAMDQLGAIASPGSTILCTYPSGTVLPTRATVRAFLGAGPETMRYVDKEAEADQFYSGTLGLSAERDLLARYALDYVYYGPSEQALGRPEVLATLPIVIDNGSVRVYDAGGVR
jgi:hypothetical protein